MNTELPLLSVVLSFRNEAQVIPELIRRLQAVLTPLPVRYEIIFVNDCSTDQSLELLLEHRAKDLNIKIINTARRFGVTPCLLAGFQRAQGDAVICMDTDLQDPPELIPALVEKWQRGADVVHTIRLKRHGENPLKIWITKQAYRIIRNISEYPLLENSGDFKLINRRVMDILLSMHENDPYMRGLVGWIGFRQEQVHYDREARYAGKTKFPLMHSMGPCREFFRGITGFSDIPLYLGFLCAGGFLLAAATALSAIIISSFQGHEISPWLILATLFCFTAALLFVLISLLGVYLGAVLRQVRHRPYCLTQELIGFTDTPSEEIH